MSDRHEQLHAYIHLREHLVALHMALIERLPGRVLKDAQKKLGLHRVGSEAAKETAQVVLIDYALYHYRPGGRTLFEAHFESHPPAPGSHDEQLRLALAGYRYTIVEVEDVEPGAGAEVYDTLYRQSFFLMDRGLSQSATDGMRFATGVLPLPEYAMTTGAALPIGWDTMNRIEQDLTRRFGDLGDLDPDALTPHQQADLAARILHYALRDDAAEGIAYR